MDYRLSNIIKDEMPTKQKIMIYALDMFNSKGYSDTTIRDIALAVGITSGSIYSHFSSKEELLQSMLNDYTERTKNLFFRIDIKPILQENPTGEGISMCIEAGVKVLSTDVYYANLVHLIHQEQHRIPICGALVLLRLKDTMEFVDSIFDVLKEMNVIKADTSSEYWGFYTYSVLHFLPTCQALHRVQNSQGYGIIDSSSMLSNMFDAMLIMNKP